MRKILISSAALILTATTSFADIQAPPGAAYTSTRKLGRAISNILYGIVEIPEQIVRKNEQYGRKAGWSYGLVDGTQRAFSRVGYGFYELVTFRCPTFHGTFKQPYMKCGQDNRIEMNVHDGLSEFPPELGFETYYTGHVRSQKY
ncbi:putative exosortase-associated protein, TIGR04073 family [Rubritalea squalenifaciens DSM 18772]|uniref:Putative exosortase-associated protein, TIGR04073 family n=1 Tax=Rubritalea squalenifaciens DSM 18772 TaxID=1123071 RepID=A0A1M6HQU4_9BACT|nr:exosortase system-associated protein, TIGR04073 family [Rubritalea squalenifaciens]SHJ24580.1 putative exosortase-associated protein, TIGR04073 family [Rubritalea squalenifaciens DSM 18772]